MADRYDVLTARESNGKTYFTKIGAMFSNRSGDGFTVMLDAMPASMDGQFRLIVKRPQERDGQQRGGGNQQSRSSDDWGDGDTPF